MTFPPLTRAASWEPPGDWLRLTTVDAHTGGEPFRVITSGLPALAGDTILARRRFAKETLDHLRTALMWEPRGHADMYGCIVTPPVTPGADLGVLFLHNEGFSTMCGHGVIAVATVAVERGLIGGREAAGSHALTFDAPAGQVRAHVDVVERRGAPRVDHVSFLNVPSFVLAAGVGVPFDSRTLHVDVAFGGAFYAIVDAESAGLAVTADRLPALRQAGMAIKRAIDAAVTVVHPLEPGLTGVYGTIFTAPASRPDADLRNVTVFADAEVDRSPCGTGTCAVLAVLDAMGLVDADRPFVHESIIGTTFRARVAGRTTVGSLPAIVPELSGEAWITGEHTFLVERDDPLSGGFRL
jgi:proline racemase